MPCYHALDQYIQRLEKQGYRFVIKDFVGFLNWSSPLKEVLRPYTRHASSYCYLIKSNIMAFHRCIDCVNILQRRCRRERMPFWTTCCFGVVEFNIPIWAQEVPIGVISVGCFCHEGQALRERLDKLSQQYGFERTMLDMVYEESLCMAKCDTEELLELFGFISEYIANVCEPYLTHKRIAYRYDNTPDTSFEKIHAYILQEFTDSSISLEKIAKACNYSTSSVSHLFHDNLHMNIRKYINQLRVSKAEKLLRNGKSIVAVAMECGFNDPSYFANTFSSVMGVSPSEYQKQRLSRQRTDPFAARHPKDVRKS